MIKPQAKIERIKVKEGELFELDYTDEILDAAWDHGKLISLAILRRSQ